MILRSKSTWLAVSVLMLLCLCAADCNGTPEPTVENTPEITRESTSAPAGHCLGELEVEQPDVARVTPAPREVYSVGATDSWTAPPFGVEVIGPSGKATMWIRSADGTLRAKYTIIAADRSDGSVGVNRWNGSSEIAFHAGNVYIEDRNSQELCNLRLFAGGVGITSQGTTYVITIRPEINEVKVAVLNGAVDLTSHGETVTLDAAVTSEALAVITDGDIGPLLPIPDPAGVVDTISEGGDIVIPEPAVTDTPAPTTEPTLEPPSMTDYDLGFASDRNGDFNIFLMDTANPSDWISLPLPGDYERAWWPSFCGGYVAGEMIDQDGVLPQWIYLTDLVSASLWSPETSGPRLGVPRCSPSAEYLAYSISSGSEWNLYVARFDGSSPLLVDDEGLSGNASWLSDNHTFYSMAGGRLATPFIIRYVNNVQQPAELNVTTVTAGKYPAVSPDGSQVAYICGDELSLCLWDVSSASSSILYAITYVRLDGLPVPASPAWSADGQWIYFPSAEDGDWDIYRVRPDGSELENITPDWPSNELMPALQW
jgi:hypothetical protein